MKRYCIAAFAGACAGILLTALGMEPILAGIVGGIAIGVFTAMVGRP